MPDPVMIGLVKERLSQDDCNSGFILDGFPRTIHQAEVLDSFLEKENKPITNVLLLDVESEILVKRLTSRRLCRNCGKDYNMITNPPTKESRCKICGGEVYRRADDCEETVINRLQVYDAQTKPLLEYYEKRNKLSRIDGSQTIQTVQGQITKIVST